MSFLDFLTDGKPIPVATGVTSMTESTALPDWYTAAAQQTLANQAALMAQPYTTFQGPRVAGFTPAQQQAFQQTASASQLAQPGLSRASGALGSVAASSAGAKAASGYLGQAAGLSGLAAAQPAFGQAQQYVGQATQGGGLEAAQPYLTGASQTSVANIADYMNPYTQQVVDRIGEVGLRTLQERLIPGISDQMTAAGQFGGTRQAELMGRALRDTMGEISAQQAAALASGYGQAATLSSGDLTRQAQLASTAGQLGTAGQEAMLQAAQQMGTLGQYAGQLTGQEQQNLANIGSTAGTLAQGDAGNRIRAAQAQADVAAQQQASALQGAGALANVGAQQQALGQKSLDTAYQDFLRQQGYPQEQVNAMLGTLQGVAGAVPKAEIQEGVSPVSTPQQYTPSAIGQAATTATSVAALASALKDLGIKF